jgi:periplasmic protein TonB
MRTASFFILSVSLHAVALAFPVTFAARSSAPIPVTIFSVKSESVDAGNNGERAARAAGIKSSSPTPRSLAGPAGAMKPAAMAPQIVGGGTEVATVNDSAIAWISPSSEPHAGHGNAVADSSAGFGRSAGGDATGSGMASRGSGLGSGSGKGGAGSDGSDYGVALTQASYRDTPRPEYPDGARREGREGRVLLRVLIDDQGRTKTVEINTSSGSSILDRAAAEAIQRWRFHPARYGDQPVESWLRIPIEFRLADAKSR